MKRALTLSLATLRDFKKHFFHCCCNGFGWLSFIFCLVFVFRMISQARIHEWGWARGRSGEPITASTERSSRPLPIRFAN